MSIIKNDVSIDCVWSWSLEANFSFLCYDYKTLLQFFTRVSTTISTGIVQELQEHMPHTYLKVVNNHNTFFSTDSHLQSISRLTMLYQINIS